MQLNRHALRALRERSGLSVSALAAAAGVSQPHLSNVERGRRRASPGLVRRLAAALQVPVVALLADLDDPVSSGADAPPLDAPADPTSPTRPSRAGPADLVHRPPVPDPPSGGEPPAKGALMPTITAHPGDVPVLEPTATGGRSRRAAAAAVGVATAASVLAAGAPAHAETYYTGGCTVYSQVNGSSYPRAFQARIVGSIEQGTGKYIWDHYDYSYVIDPHLTFGGSSDEVVTVTSGYDSGLSNPWSSPDNHGSNGGFLTEANWKGVKSYWGFTKVKFHAAFDVPGTPDPHCDASTGTV